MIYGNGSNEHKECALCNEKIDGHRFNKIESSDESNQLSWALSDALVDIYKGTDNEKSLLLSGTLLMGRNQEDRDGVMLGAIIAKTKYGIIKAVALSGSGDIRKIFDVMRSPNLGKDVVRISALPDGKHYNIWGVEIEAETVGLHKNRDDGNPNIGQCAAPKLISYVMSHNKKNERDFIQEIHMSECYFKVNNTRSNYSTNPNTPVESCGTCKNVLPLMLCDKYDYAAV